MLHHRYMLALPFTSITRLHYYEVPRQQGEPGRPASAALRPGQDVASLVVEYDVPPAFYKGRVMTCDVELRKFRCGVV